MRSVPNVLAILLLALMAVLAGGAARRQFVTIDTFTAGPARAIRSSSPGLSGMRSMLATPPIGKSVISRVLMPKYRAVSTCPYS